MRIPICGCGRVMDCSTTGLKVLTITDDGQDYQLWSSDEYECPNCGAKVAAINSSAPIAEHWQPGFERAKRAAEAPGAGGRRMMMRAYYGHVPARPDGDKTIAGVALGPYLESVLEGIKLLAAPSIHDRSAESTVDSTTDAADDPQHHGDTTQEPDAR